MREPKDKYVQRPTQKLYRQGRTQKGEDQRRWSSVTELGSLEQQTTATVLNASEQQKINKRTADGPETGPSRDKDMYRGQEKSQLAENKEEMIIMLISKGKDKYNDDSSHCLAMAFSNVLVKPTNDVSTGRSYVVSVLTGFQKWFKMICLLANKPRIAKK